MSCKSILPINLDKIINILDLAGCKRLELLREDASKIKDLNNPLTVDKKFLNKLADNYEAWFFKEFEELEFRKLIKASQFLYSKLGTIFAIKEVLRSFDIKTEIKEWFEYQGKPYHFKIVIEPQKNKAIDKDFILRLVRLIDKVKNVRSVLEAIEMDIEATCSFYLSSALNMQIELTNEWKLSWNNKNINYTGAVAWQI